MGVDFHVYVGPYIEIKTTKQPTHMVEYEYHGCSNEQCAARNDGQRGKFCSICGSPITLIKGTSEEEWDLMELAEEYELLEKVSPDYSEETNGDTQIWFPNVEDTKGGSWSVKYEDIWEDLTDLDVKEEIRKVEEECAEALKTLEEIYGVKPVIKWGVISSTS